MTRDALPISILLVDDHPLVRRSLHTLLNTQVDIEVVGEAENGTQTLELAMELEPDVLILDLVIPEMDGFAVLRELAKWHDAPQVIVCSFWESLRAIALAAGATAFIGKAQIAAALIPTLRALASSRLRQQS